MYGHGYEVFSVATDGAEAPDTLLASSCKASKAEHAEVLLWREEEEEWKVAQRLRAHNLTVTQMAFSPCRQALLTVSRDRTWALFERDQVGH